MPQLSPMMSFVMFLLIMTSFLVLIMFFNKKYTMINTYKNSKKSKNSSQIF